MKRAAIAIGSNSTRLLIAQRQQGMLTNIQRGREETRLFLGLDDQGRIAPDKLESTAQAVAALAGEARRQGAESLALFATSATRDAKNGGELAARIRRLCGLELQIISGEEEARLAFLAAAGMEKRLVMDIGGGSTEFTLGDQGRIQWAVSAQMGASRLLKMQPIRCTDDALSALALAKETLLNTLGGHLAAGKGTPMIGLGGSCTTAAAIRMGREAHGEGVEGEVVSLREAKRQLLLLSSMTEEERSRVPGLPPSRAAHMPHGLCILIAALEIWGLEELQVSGKTNLDGYLLSCPE